MYRQTRHGEPFGKIPARVSAPIRATRGRKNPLPGDEPPPERPSYIQSQPAREGHEPGEAAMVAFKKFFDGRKSTSQVSRLCAFLSWPACCRRLSSSPHQPRAGAGPFGDTTDLTFHRISTAPAPAPSGPASPVDHCTVELKAWIPQATAPATINSPVVCAVGQYMGAPKYYKRDNHTGYDGNVSIRKSCGYRLVGLRLPHKRARSHRTSEYLHGSGWKMEVTGY